MKTAVFVLVLLCLGARFGSGSTVQACGKSLSELLSLVCEGIYNEPEKRSFTHNNDGLFQTEDFFLPMRLSRGVADECCHRPCSFSTLRSYCG
ncbi:ilGF domain-containing protein [Caerostris extrusa]|uniref:IlGF domain-containing protein n=1 Tax=Caerostris extrusa TaxID=172846 RepID=A0AAV4NZT4_CAEEX|nr:ilGF domain-containing protein [Caerostris extrusa]